VLEKRSDGNAEKQSKARVEKQSEAKAADLLNTDPNKGLTSDEAQERLARFGPNRLVERKPVTFVDIFLEEIREPLIVLLLIVAVFYSVFGKLIDTVTIVFVVIALVSAEVFNEYRAKKAIEALKKLSAPLAPVIRDGHPQEIPTEDIVPGDILIIRVGERIQADAYLVESYGLEVDESALTGESVPVPKSAKAKPSKGAPLGERTNEVFAGTVVTRGKGRAVVLATGMATELGHITGLVRESKEPKTPLQLAMRELSSYLIWVATAFSIFIPLVGIVQGRGLQEMILTGLSLAFATIPEEMPIIITMVLGLGALQLSRHNALVKRLRAAETLGSVTMIASDKTGTITENRMVLSHISADGMVDFKEGKVGRVATMLLEIGVLVNDAVLQKVNGMLNYVGDPMEVALIEAATKAGKDPQAIRNRFDTVEEFGFDSDIKLMTGVFALGGNRFVFTKGAPEAILSRSTNYETESGVMELTPSKKKEELGKVDMLASKGLRMLAFAYKKISEGELVSREEAENSITYVGLAGFLDPPRHNVAEAVRETKEAGIRILMMTGDYAPTALAIARDVGISTDHDFITSDKLKSMNDSELQNAIKSMSVFARITPEDKLRIVNAAQLSGHVIAVTGDGINDAPALSQANIGIAMGETGTDVAREAADMVLTDDNFSTIEFAVRGGRRIFDNLRKGVRYYLAVKLGLILLFLLPILAGIALPFAPIQIIVLELFMDLGASAAFVAEPEAPDIMKRTPRKPSERFIDRPMLIAIFTGALVLFVSVSFAYLIVLFNTGSTVVAQTTAFTTWIFTHIFLAFNMRSDKEPVLRLGLLSNKPMVIWAVSAIIVAVLVVTISVFHPALKLTFLTFGQWALAIGVAFISTLWMEVRKLLFRIAS